MRESKKQLWYHCGRCGSLFGAEFGEDEKRVCADCGNSPKTGMWPIEEKNEAERKGDRMAFSKQPEAIEVVDGRHAVRKKRKGNLMLKIVISWTFIMLLAVWLRHHYGKTGSEQEALDKIALGMTKGTLADENVALLNGALPDCHRALGGFLTAGTPESRNQFVVDPIQTAGKMAAFYSFNQLPKVDVKSLRRTGQEVIQVGGSRMILTRWQEPDGVEFDAVFRKDSGTWRLDWKHFSRYSEYPWTLFLAGDGPNEAEFRLLARQRLTDLDSERIGSRLVFTMFAPVFGKPNETGMESPDFIVDRRSDEGLLLGAALADREAGRRIFGQTLPLPEADSDIRIHVRVKRSELGGIRTFTLEKVIACHWIDSEATGYELTELKDDLFTN